MSIYISRFIRNFIFMNRPRYFLNGENYEGFLTIVQKSPAWPINYEKYKNPKEQRTGRNVGENQRVKILDDGNNGTKGLGTE